MAEQSGQGKTNIEQYLSTNKEKILPVIEEKHVKASILYANIPNDMQQAGELIRQGKLVAFPTETVYGLGANALDEKAVRSIFATKRRPLSDPVIVHIAKKEDGLKLVKISEGVKRVYNYLADKFWPGPLTLILQANFDVLSRVVTAQTDFVGIRCPNHPIAHKLLEAADRPIAAPSANLFAHVSPTNGVHVFNDFYDQDITVLEAQQGEGLNCEFGIESSVVKIVEKENGQFDLLMLRFGSLSVQQLNQAINESQEFKGFVNVVAIKKENTVQEQQNQEAPGQLLKHYSPYINSYLFQIINGTSSSTSSSSGSSSSQTSTLKESLNINSLVSIPELNLCESIIFDYMDNSKQLSSKCLKYVSLSEKGDMREIMTKLYDSLRWAENVPEAKNILIYNLHDHFASQDGHAIEHLDTVYDKIFRSTSGKKVLYEIDLDEFFLQPAQSQ